MAGYIGWGSFGQDLFQGTHERAFHRPGWNEEAAWLREHLGKPAWESAQRSIINAHYTDPPTVQAMWDMARGMGFTGGRVLEPSMGIGNFFGLMPRDIMGNSTLTGIELDDTTGRMAKLLYPDAGVHIKGYQDSHTPDNFYDFVIGNWPFAAQSPPDRRYDRLSPTLHDYFFLKALDQTRPGGLVMGITSAGTMDKASRAARLALATKGELIAAFRLPTGAFEKYAGTSVVTDILIFRKRGAPAENPAGEPWIDASDMETPSGEKIRVNNYFQAHPEAVLGTLDYGHGTTSGRAGMIVHRPADLMERLAALPSQVPANAWQPVVRGNEPRFLVNHTSDRQNSVTIGPDGELYQVKGERLVSLQDLHKPLTSGPAKAVRARDDQVRRLVDLRKAHGALIDAERDGRPDTEELRQKLAGQFEQFRAAHGPIGKSDGLRVLDKVEDPSHPVLEALERPDGTPSRMLSEPTIRSRKAAGEPTIANAYITARNETANIDMNRVAALSGQPREAVERHLLDSGAVMRAPGGGFEASDAYLSGNVRRKLREAKDALANGEPMEGSVKALTEAIPPTVPYYQIEAKLGAPWVGDAAYKQFIADLLGLKGKDADAVRVRFAGSRWKVTFAQPWINNMPEARTQWGHERYPFNKLVMAAMGNNVVRVMDPRDSDGGPYFNAAASEEVNAKIQGLREKFTDWAWQDPSRRVAFETAYNDAMNAIARPRYDGSFLDMSGMALRRGEDPFALRQHQINAIWRGVALGRGLFAHEVGTGKTYTMGGIAVEGRRYGVFRKPLVFAHNANSASVAREMQEMYPGGKFLYIDNLAPNAITTTMHRIANDDWDAVIMPHSLIDRMAMKRETLMELAQEQIAELENEAIEAAAEDNIKLTPEMMDDPEQMKKVRSQTAKQLVKQREAIIASIEKQSNRSSREGAIPFEDLGVDAIIVDEAHEFKKPPIATRMQLRGLNTQTSNRSIALNFLTGYVKKQNSGKGVYLFTGTPVTNALNEIFNMSRYFMDGRMAENGIKDWDAWFNTFADAATDVELTAAGTYEPVKRLAAFVNVDELVRMMSEFTDVVQAKDMPEFVARPAPSGKTLSSPDLTSAERDFLTNGRTPNGAGRPYKKIITDVAGMSPAQQAILATLRKRSAEFKAADGKQRREWLLAGDPRTPIRVETDAANAGLDARMYDPDAPDTPDTKINRVARNVLRHYAEPDAGQVIFVDRGYNAVKSSEGREARFVLVRDLVKRLTDGGILKEQIAIVGGGVTAEKKKAIADAMNSGKLRVVIGLSSTLGVGVNMQKNLRAMHHMDAPWRPGDLEQRNGRGERQGNDWNTVLEYRYVTEGIDGRRWQVLTSKDRFIKQFIGAFNDTSGKRLGNIEGDAADISDDEDIVSTLSSAAGDPRIMLKEKYKADVNRLERRERMHTIGLEDTRAEVSALQRSSRERTAAAAAHAGWARTWTEASERAAAAAKEAGDTHRWYEATVNGQPLRAGADIQAAIDPQVQALVRGERRDLAVINGFTVEADWSGGYQKPNYYLRDAEGGQAAKIDHPTMPRIIAEMRGHGTLAEYNQGRATDIAESIPRLESMLGEPFPQQETLNKKRQQLANLEDDLAGSPIPPPGWLRHGAPIDSDIHVNGEARQVRGHRMSDDYYLVTDAGDVPYLEAKDANGARMFDVHPAPEQPKAAAGTDQPPNGPPDDNGPKFSKRPLPLYSPVARAAETLKQARGTGEQMLAMITKAPGVKPEEIKWLGLAPWLRGQKTVTREQVQDYIRANALDIQEVTKGGTQSRTRYREYALPGGENYREMLITMPPKNEPPAPPWKVFHQDEGPERPVAAFDTVTEARADIARRGAEYQYRMVPDSLPPEYHSAHWNEPNVLAHVRFDGRTAPDGKKVLMVQEVQSDWGQDLRKGAAAPSMPFKTSWPALAMKRMIQYAVDNGFDRVAWSPGEVHAERYQLESDAGMKGFYDRILPAEVQKIVGKYGAKVEKTAIDASAPSREMRDEIFPDEQAHAEHGEERARLLEQIRAFQAANPRDPGIYRLFTLRDNLYDRMINDTLVRSGKSKMDTTVFSFDITPQLKNITQTEGMPLFSETKPPAAETPRPEATQAMADAIHAMLGGKARVELADAADGLTIHYANGTTSQVDGYAVGRVLRVAIAPGKTFENLNHEALHVLRNMGVFTPPEWRLLEAAARREGWVERYDINERYAELSPSQRLEEAIADRLGETSRHPGPEGKSQAALLLSRLRARLRAFFARLREFLAGRGFKTADDVFAAVRSGEAGAREPGSGMPRRGPETIPESQYAAGLFNGEIDVPRGPHISTAGRGGASAAPP